MYQPKERAIALALAALFVAAAVSTAAAQVSEGQAVQPPPEMAAAFIKEHDTDGDGKVSQAEALAPHEARFKELDANGDGFVTVEEFRQSFEAQVPLEARQRMKERGLGDPGESFIKELDKNGDGKVDLSEALVSSVEGFKRMDADGDGFATRAEVDAFLSKMWEAMSRMHRQAHPPAQ
jgi:Ca2+-binding EF-hand superfamily protein